MKASTLIMAMTGVIGVGGFAAWRVNAVTSAAPPAHVAILNDRSTSMPMETQCSAAVGLTEEALSKPDFRKGSQLTLLGTGDSFTNMEPLELGVFKAPHATRAMSARRDLEEQRAALLRGIHDGCDGAGRATSSPIVLGIRRALQVLRADGCDGGRPCAVFVVTDGLETTEPRLARAVLGKAKKQDKLTTVLDNTGITVRFCGLAETRTTMKRASSERSTQSAERLERTWKAVFTAPDLVRMEPFCPKGQFINPRRPSGATSNTQDKVVATWSF
ncbi:MAG: hypothetical protein AB2A00_26795 [Myxococcota bacterium]